MGDNLVYCTVTTDCVTLALRTFAPSLHEEVDKDVAKELNMEVVKDWKRNRKLLQFSLFGRKISLSYSQLSLEIILNLELCHFTNVCQKLDQSMLTISEIFHFSIKIIFSAMTHKCTI